MIKQDEKIIMKSIMICFKPFLKPEEAQLYTNLEHTQFKRKIQDFFVQKTITGYYRKEDLDKMMNGDTSLREQAVAAIRYPFKK